MSPAYKVAVLSAVSSLAYHLSLAVAVEVVYHKLSIVRTCTDIYAQVNTPEESAVQLIAVDDYRASIAGISIILGV